MKFTKKQRILNYAKQHPEGFTPKKMMEDTKIKDKNIWVILSKMKKEGLLMHDPKTSIYKPGDVQQPLKAFNKKKPVRVTAPALKPIRDTATSNMIDRMMRELRMADEKYQDSLAIIRYLESKLLTAIQHDARGQG